MRRLNKRDFDGTVQGLPRSRFIVQRKPIKNKDHYMNLNAADVHDNTYPSGVHLNAFSSPAEFCFKPAFGIGRGTANGERIGNQIRAIRLQVDLLVKKYDPAIERLEGYRGPIRLLVFYDTQNNQEDMVVGGSVFDEGGLLQTGPTSVDTRALRTMDSRKRFIVLKDTQIYESEWLDKSQTKHMVHKRFVIPLKHTIMWDDTDTTGAYSGINKNALYIYVLTQNENAEEPLRHLSCITRLQYQDA